MNCNSEAHRKGRAAWHEAGHIVVARAVGIEVFEATIVPRPEFAGGIRIDPNQAENDDFAAMLLAGFFAQLQFCPRCMTFNSFSWDYERARAIGIRGGNVFGWLIERETFTRDVLAAAPEALAFYAGNLLLAGTLEPVPFPPGTLEPSAAALARPPREPDEAAA